MTNFRTELTPAPSEHKISLHSPILTLGSCFADTMGQRLVDYKFPTIANPFGVIFNPVSLATLLGQVLDERLPREDHYLQHNGLWQHFDLHSDFAHPDLTTLERALQTTWLDLRNHFMHCKWLVITLGTTTVYQLKESGQIVANCHKVSADAFEKKHLTVAEVQGALSYVLEKLWEKFPQIRVVLTVSPVRHLKDTLQTNSLSKATLRVAAGELEERYEQVQYFPAYELMMDDLRDYRFYSEDMLHLAPTAQDYVWQKFTEAYLDEGAQAFLPAWEQIRRAIAHRPRQPESEAHQAFLRKTLEKLALWDDVVDTSKERELLEGQLVS